jgi:hypothetical protein
MTPSPSSTNYYTPYATPTTQAGGTSTTVGWNALGDGVKAGVIVAAALLVTGLGAFLIFACRRWGKGLCRRRGYDVDDLSLGRSLDDREISEEPLTRPRSNRRMRLWMPMLPTIFEVTSTSPSLIVGARNSIQGCIDRATRAVSVMTRSSSNSGATRAPKITHIPPSPTISMHDLNAVLNAVGGDPAPLPPQDFRSVYTVPYALDILPALPDSPATSNDTNGTNRTGEEFFTAQNSREDISTAPDNDLRSVRFGTLDFNDLCGGGFPLYPPGDPRNDASSTRRDSDVIWVG